MPTPVISRDPSVQTPVMWEAPIDPFVLSNAVNALVYGVAGGLVGKYVLGKDFLPSAAVAGGTTYAAFTLYSETWAIFALRMIATPVTFVIGNAIMRATNPRY